MIIDILLCNYIYIYIYIYIYSDAFDNILSIKSQFRLRSIWSWFSQIGIEKNHYLRNHCSVRQNALRPHSVSTPSALRLHSVRTPSALRPHSVRTPSALRLHPSKPRTYIPSLSHIPSTYSALVDPGLLDSYITAATKSHWL